MDHQETRELDRRTLLSQAVAATATLGALAPLRGYAEEEPAAPRTGGDRVRVGVMGLRNRGLALMRGFAKLPEAEVAWLCDVDQQVLGEAVRQHLAEGHAEPKTTRDLRHMLDDPRVDAIAIATPDHWHGPATILACAAGKHVYVEKPASHNGREGELMIAAARKHRRVVQLGTQRRGAPGVCEAIERVRRGDIGEARFARAWINSTRPSIGKHGPSAPPPHVDYALWQGPAPELAYREYFVHYHWHWFWHWGTGELGNNGIHFLDHARMGLGVEVPERAESGGGKIFFDDDQETPDTQQALFHFGQKMIAWEHRTWHRRGFEGQSSGVTFYGDAGALVLDTHRYTLFDMQGKEIEQKSFDVSDAAHLQNFVDGILRGAALLAEIAEGVNSTLMCQLGNIAHRSGRPVMFDAATRSIVGEDDQQALWSREYRPGWAPVV